MRLQFIQSNINGKGLKAILYLESLKSRKLDTSYVKILSKFEPLFVCVRKKEKIATGCAVDTSVRQKTGIFAQYYNEN